MKRIITFLKVLPEIWRMVCRMVEDPKSVHLMHTDDAYYTPDQRKRISMTLNHIISQIISEKEEPKEYIQISMETGQITTIPAVDAWREELEYEIQAENYERAAELKRKISNYENTNDPTRSKTNDE